MSDLNRIPQNMGDAELLIEQLREEILRRPRLVVVDRDALGLEDLALASRDRAYTVKIQTGREEYQFESMRLSEHTVYFHPDKEHEEEGHIVPTSTGVPV
jgi:hypothetical protein